MRPAFALTFLFAVLVSQAQSGSPAIVRLTSDPGQLALRNINIGVERMSGRFAFGGLFAYRPSFQPGGEIHGGMGLFGGYSLQNSWNWVHSGLSTGAFLKWYERPGAGRYVRAELLLRHWWMNHRWTEYPNDEGYRWNGLRSERQDAVVLKCMMGEEWSWPMDHGTKSFHLEAFGGLGVRWRSVDFTTHLGTCMDEEVMNHRFQHDSWLVSLQGGLRAGISWNR